MSVQPGFGGQTFQPLALERIRRLRAMLEQAHRSVPIQVDGGINVDTAAQVRAAGATVLVAGSAIFRGTDPASAIHALRG